MFYQLQYTNLQTEKVNHAGVISRGRWSKINQNADVNIGLDPNKTRHYKDSKVRADCRFPDITFNGNSQNLLPKKHPQKVLKYSFCTFPFLINFFKHVGKKYIHQAYT